MAQSVEHRLVVREVGSSTDEKVLPLGNYIGKWLDFQVFSDKDYKLEVQSHNSFNSKISWDVKKPTHLSKRVGYEVPGVVAVLLSKVAGSKYTCKWLRMYEATKKCEHPFVRR